MVSQMRTCEDQMQISHKIRLVYRLKIFDNLIKQINKTSFLKVHGFKLIILY